MTDLERIEQELLADFAERMPHMPCRRTWAVWVREHHEAERRICEPVRQERLSPLDTSAEARRRMNMRHEHEPRLMALTTILADQFAAYQRFAAAWLDLEMQHPWGDSDIAAWVSRQRSGSVASGT